MKDGKLEKHEVQALRKAADILGPWIDYDNDNGNMANEDMFNQACHAYNALADFLLYNDGEERE